MNEKSKNYLKAINIKIGTLMILKKEKKEA